MSIKIENVNYFYGKGTPYEMHALKDITLTIPKGQFIGLIGHTGSGKSTLIQHLNGLVKATSGQIYYDDKNIYGETFKLKDLRQKVGLVFQYPEHQLFEMTVYKDIAFGPHNLNLSAEEIKNRVYNAVEKVGLDKEILEKSPFELSGGQKRRVAIAGVLAMEPEVLILDEPTAGLDPKGRDDILNEINKLQKETQKTVVLVSHSMEDIAKYVDRIIVMDKGKVKFDDMPKKIFKHYKELEEIGLGAPQITYLINELIKKGFDIKEDITTIEEAKLELIKCLKNRYI
ncbi:energy-coupling factor transport system ATP-binding protein [Natranaerovirga pectinivora]|uniref:Energy-coupling factor transporter ATP-binding protein EcfA2 n=1 Tax=Natranaerovirga pectinivora TaxID=682400 RepID=A0A4R3MIU2_9FIRM|nr:energy-coupling factor transporter ATPase [Natranaerovirga pectinivora]TCT14097.1 energy-coupling factor transport system ATP-binding protein [Natranaerovirga pectinivora]